MTASAYFVKLSSYIFRWIFPKLWTYNSMKLKKSLLIKCQNLAMLRQLHLVSYGK